MKDKLKLYMITDGRYYDEVETSKLALEGGATAIQLRMKNTTTRKMIEKGIKISRIVENYNALFFVNDRVDVALAVNAHGVHVGQNDMPPETVKKIAPNLIVGVSASSVEEAIRAEKNGADYIGAGSIFPTQTKEDAKTIGLETLKNIVDVVNIPVVAIGGINHENLTEVLKTGVAGVAVISAIVGSSDIKDATFRMRRSIDDFEKSRV